MIVMKRIFVLAAVSVFFTTCSSDLNNPDVCFQENVLPIFVNKCSMSGCHNSQDMVKGYDLSNYEGIMKGVVPKHPLQSEVYKVIKGKNPEMPEGMEPLSTKELAYIKIWIKMGAPNSSNCSACDTSNYSYSGKIQPLMDLWCTGCHNSTTTSGGYDLTSYSGIVHSITDNRLLGAIKHTSGFVAMPQNTSPLSPCDVDAVEKWINMGYPEN